MAFPKTVINALNHQVSNDYYGIDGVPLSANGTYGLWGQMKSSTDTNNQISTTINDVFGRTVSVVGPLDTISSPISQTIYTLGSTYSKILKKQKVDQSATTIDVVEYYDGSGRVIETKQKSGTPGQYVVSKQIEYDNQGRVLKAYGSYFTTNDLDTLDNIDPTKPHSTLTYDDKGRVIQRTNPDGTYSSASFNVWTTTTIDENGHMQKSYADVFGRLVKKEEYFGADGRSTQYPAIPYSLYATTNYVYDILGNLTQVIDAQNNVTNINYDNLGRKKSMQDPDMGRWIYSYDLNGNLKQQADAKRSVLTFNYDAINRLDDKNLGTQILADYIYDDPFVNYSKGRLTKVQHGSDNTNFNYDPLGRETSSSKTIDGFSYNVSRNYDSINRLKDVTYPDGAKVYYAYNEAGQIVAAAPYPLNNTTWTNGTPGSTLVGAPYAHLKLNDNNATTTVTDTGTNTHDGTGSLNTDQLTTIGKLNNAFSFNGPSQSVDVTSLANSIKTNPTGSISVWVKIDSTSGGGEVFSLAGLGTIANFQFYIYPNGNVRIFFDGQNSAGIDRKIRRTYGDPNNVMAVPGQWVHLVLTQDGTNLKLYKNGQLQTPSPSVYDYEIDPTAWFGALTMYSASYINNGYIGRIYDGTSLDYFNGQIDDFRYYSNQALTPSEISAVYNNGAGTEDDTITSPGTPAGATSTGAGVGAYITSVVYNEHGQITRMDYGNNTRTDYTYDPLTQRLTNLVSNYVPLSTPIQALQYTYDSAGNIMNITDYVYTGTQSFMYDALNRLTSATGHYCAPNPGSSAPTLCTQNYQFDTIGNIRQKDGKTYFYGGAGPHAVTSLSDGTQFSYDKNGNMIQKREPQPSATNGLPSRVTWNYIYDAENRMTSVVKNGVKVADYAYDGDGGRVKKTDYSASNAAACGPPLCSGGISFGHNPLVSATVTHYVGSLFERDNFSRIDTKYIYFGSQRIASINNLGKTKYFLGDHLGSTNVMADALGTPTELIEYKPFGSFARHDYFGNPADTTHYYFTGHYYDAESKLIFMQARYYDPELGRFIAPDAIVQNPTDPSTLNRYSYVSNNPINRIDPDGRSWKKFFKAIWNTFKFIHNPVQSNPFVNGIVTGNWSYARDMAIAAATGFLFGGGPIGAATAAVTTAVMRTPAAQWTTENLAHSVFDNAFGMSPRTAYIFSTITVSVGVSLGAEKMLASASGAKPVDTKNGTELSDADFEKLQEGYYAGDENMFGPSLKTKDAQFDQIKGLFKDDKLVGSIQKGVLDVPGLKQLGAQHTSVNALNATGQSLNPLSYATWGVCHQAANATLLNAGISSTVLNLGPSWDAFVTTAVYGNYGGQLRHRIFSGVNANQNYEE